MTKEEIIEVVRQDRKVFVTRADLYAGLEAYEEIVSDRVPGLRCGRACFIQDLFVTCSVATDSGFVQPVRAIRAIAE